MFALVACLLMSLEPNWQTYPVLRPDVTTGYGKIIDDLEQHSVAKHPMRNKVDPGNWAHELTHFINSKLREPGDNCFYFLEGRYVRLPEPKITILQVARFVDDAHRGTSYDIYFRQSRSWVNQPLYLMDEASAYANGLAYHVEAGTKDNNRVEIANEFVVYSKALLAAVRKLDPEYPKLHELSVLVSWYEKRIKYLTDRYNGKPVNPLPPDDYILY